MTFHEPRSFATEAVILLRTESGASMMVHVPKIYLELTAIVNEPDIVPMASLYTLPPNMIEGYEVAASGVADRLTIWQGPDLFTKAEIEQPALGIPSSRDPE